MGINSFVGNNMNFAIQMGGTPPSASGASNGGLDGLQDRFNSAKDKLGNDKTDQGALQDLRTLKKDVDSALQKEVAKENSGEAKMQDMLEKLLEMVMELLQEVMGGDEKGEGKGADKDGGGDKGKCHGGSKGQGKGQGQGQGGGTMSIQITL